MTDQAIQKAQGDSGDRLKLKPEDMRSTETFFTVGRGHNVDPETEKSILGFFMIWVFQKNLADFTSPKIDIELVKKLYHKELSIVQFVDDAMKGTMTSKVLTHPGDDFAKYYFKWKYLEEFKSVFSDKCEATWDNYEKIKPSIEKAYVYFAANPTKAIEEKIKEQDPSARLGQLGVRGEGHMFQIPPHPNTTFDEENFLVLLEGSISLTLEEKEKVIDAIPRLKIEQINELIAIFEEEKVKFSELEHQYGDDVSRLKQEREKELNRKEEKVEEQNELSSDEEEAERIKREMGL